MARDQFKLALHKSNVQRFELKNKKYSKIRVGVVVATLVATVITTLTGSEGIAWVLLGTGTSLFFALVIIHASIRKRLAMWRKRLWQVENCVIRSRNDVAKLPLKQAYLENDANEDQHNATDLNLIGKYSLLRLLDSTFTPLGLGLLRTLLTADTLNAKEMVKRQAIVRSLLRLNVFRRRFLLIGCLNNDKSANSRGVFEKFANTSLVSSKAAKSVVGLACALYLGWALVLGVAGANGGAITVFILIYTMLWLRVNRQFRGAHGVLDEVEHSLQLMIPVLRCLEDKKMMADQELDQLRQQIKNDSPSKNLRSIQTVLGFLAIRTNALLQLVLNLIVPWDFLWLLYLEKWRKNHASNMVLWVDELAQFEAYASIAEYCASQSNACFPETAEPEEDVVACVDLSHALMSPDSRVGNSFVLGDANPCNVLTGSNMSGKSTFLRTLGIALRLAAIGSTVPATSFRCRSVTIKTLIRAEDSLAQEMSLFYFEVKRLAQILHLAKSATQECPVLYLIDEIFRGTNNEERFVGARYFINAIVKAQAYGLVATHDLRLADLNNEHVKNYYFKDDVKGDRIVFDHLLREGVCRSTNAMKIMAQEGLPISD